ncbi:MAG TPA: hypothetical protein DIU37_01100 [Opitutae bacterium]|nr:hypothetical protein [Opitutae bacterium]
MQTIRQKLISTKAVIFDLFLTAIFFVCMVWVCDSHVFIEVEPTRTILACFTALCLTGVFWLGLQLFRVTLSDQRQQRRKQ